MYYIVFGILYLFSLLPFFILYRISDLIFLILFYITGYRKQVVMQNLQNSFPEKNQTELKIIARSFYKNFVDNWIETIKLLSISKKTLNKRITANVEVFHQLHKKGKSVQLNLGHFFNWEFGSLYMSLVSRFPFIVVYMPVKNKVFDRLILKLRQRFKGIMVPATNFRRSFRPYSRGRYALTLVADQNPGNPKQAYWMPFFGRMVPFLSGPEKGTRSSNDAVVFARFYRVKRGYYKLDFTLLTTEPRSYKEGALTKELIKLIEESIRKKPSNYLWSHRRWKWEYTDEYKDLVID